MSLCDERGWLQFEEISNILLIRILVEDKALYSETNHPSFLGLIIINLGYRESLSRQLEVNISE
jgi:hypothetical protein